ADRIDGRGGALRGSPTRRTRARADAARGQGGAARLLVMLERPDAATATTIGVAGGTRDASVDGRGRVSPRAATWELDWWIGADDRWRVPAREAAVRQQLVDGMPVVQTAMRVPSGDARQVVFGAPVADAGEVAVVEITNDSPAPFVAAFVVRGASAIELDGSTV